MSTFATDTAVTGQTDARKQLEAIYSGRSRRRGSALVIVLFAAMTALVLVGAAVVQFGVVGKIF
jgi:hypothetical protein